MDGILSIVKRTELFAAFPDEALIRNVLPHGQLREYPKDRFLIEPQEIISRFGIVMSGKIQIMHIFQNGNYGLMSTLTAGEILGADLICTRSRISPYHAVAAAPTRVLYLPVALLTAPGLLPEDLRLDALTKLTMLISHENMKKEYRLAILSQKGLRERIMTYLTMQSTRLHKTTFSIPLSREDLAAFLCVNRSALSHELSLMQQDGLITFRKNVFSLNQKPATPSANMSK